MGTGCYLALQAHKDIVCFVFLWHLEKSLIRMEGGGEGGCVADDTGKSFRKRGGKRERLGLGMKKKNS